MIGWLQIPTTAIWVRAVPESRQGYVHVIKPNASDTRYAAWSLSQDTEDKLIGTADTPVRAAELFDGPADA